MCYLQIKIFSASLLPSIELIELSFYLDYQYTILKLNIYIISIYLKYCLICLFQTNWFTLTNFIILLQPFTLLATLILIFYTCKNCYLKVCIYYCASILIYLFNSLFIFAACILLLISGFTFCLIKYTSIYKFHGQCFHLAFFFWQCLYFIQKFELWFSWMTVHSFLQCFDNIMPKVSQPQFLVIRSSLAVILFKC